MSLPLLNILSRITIFVLSEETLYETENKSHYEIYKENRL